MDEEGQWENEVEGQFGLVCNNPMCNHPVVHFVHYTKTADLETLLRHMGMKHPDENQAFLGN